MRYFIDTEFVEDGRTIDLLSLAMVKHVPDTELDKPANWLYVINKSCGFSAANGFVTEHVLPNLQYRQAPPRWATPADIKTQVLDFIEPDRENSSEIEFWGYYADYDWVAFCQLFGSMSALPGYFPQYCCDLQQILHDHRVTPPFPGSELHNALEDALWNCKVYNWLNL